MSRSSKLSLCTLILVISASLTTGVWLAQSIQRLAQDMDQVERADGGNHGQ